MEKHRGRITDFDGVGATSHNNILGFFSHNQLVISRQTKQPIGWSDIYLYNRPVNNKPFIRPNNAVPICEKESNKWLGPSIKTRDEILNQSSHSLYVMDREADIYEVLSSLPNEKCDYLIRAKHDRKVFNCDHQLVKLKSDLKGKGIKSKITLLLSGENKKRRKRKARCEIRYETYRIPRPEKICDREKYPASIEATAVMISECDAMRNEEEPVEWILWTSEQVNSKTDALDKLHCYASRWKIEEAHRLLKTKGFDIESSELESGTSIRKLLIIAMEASIKVMQLKEARDGQTQLKTKEVFEENEIKFLEILNEKLQGQTEKLSNKHPKDNLAWASWIVARLGGWKGYESQRPPGTITFKTGLDKFNLQYEGFLIAQQFL